MILFVKVKEKDLEKVRFEILTRSPFNGYDFLLDKFTFNEFFRFSENNKINVNIANNKNDIYECLDKPFFNKMLWWNEHIEFIHPMYVDAYEKETNTSRTSWKNLEYYKDLYKEEMEEDQFQFMLDYKFYLALLNSAVECVYA